MAGGDEPAEDMPVDDKPVADDKPADDKPAADDKPVDNMPVDDKPTDDKPADEKPADEKPADDKPATDSNPAVDDKPADDKPADDKPATDSKPAADDKPADKPADDKPADDKPADDKPGDDKPADDKPGDDKPADDKPADKPKEAAPADGGKPADDDAKPADTGDESATLQPNPPTKPKYGDRLASREKYPAQDQRQHSPRRGQATAAYTITTRRYAPSASMDGSDYMSEEPQVAQDIGPAATKLLVVKQIEQARKQCRRLELDLRGADEDYSKLELSKVAVDNILNDKTRALQKRSLQYSSLAAKANALQMSLDKNYEQMGTTKRVERVKAATQEARQMAGTKANELKDGLDAMKASELGAAQDQQDAIQAQRDILMGELRYEQQNYSNILDATKADAHLVWQRDLELGELKQGLVDEERNLDERQKVDDEYFQKLQVKLSTQERDLERQEGVITEQERIYRKGGEDRNHQLIGLQLKKDAVSKVELGNASLLAQIAKHEENMTKLEDAMKELGGDGLIDEHNEVQTKLREAQQKEETKLRDRSNAASQCEHSKRALHSFEVTEAGFQAASDDHKARLATIMDDLAVETTNVSTLNDLLANTKEKELAELEAFVEQQKAEFAEARQQGLDTDADLTKVATSLRLKENEVLRLEARIREALVMYHAPRKAVVARNPDMVEQLPSPALTVTIKSFGEVNTGNRAPRNRKSVVSALPLDEKRRKMERGNKALVLHTTTGFESRTTFSPQSMPGVLKKVNTVHARSSAPGLNVQQNNAFLKQSLGL